MSQQRDLPVYANQELSEGHRKVDRRYRESQYFLTDQLRYSESVQDFRSIKQAIQRSIGFDVGKRAFQFFRIETPEGQGLL